MALRRTTINLSEFELSTTCMGFAYTNPPPWPVGNSLSLSRKGTGARVLQSEALVLNMHAENFDAAVRQFGLTNLEVGILPRQGYFVTDARVPRDWLLAPSMHRRLRLEQRLALRNNFPTLFRVSTSAEALLRGAWLRVSRQDPDELIERVLPGERIVFGTAELRCMRRDEAGVATRYWELQDAYQPFSLAVYDFRSPSNYEGASFRFELQEDRLVLVASSKIKADRNGWTGQAYEGPARIEYRREPLFPPRGG